MTSDRDTRSRILETARDLFFSHGFARVTMDQIAATLGMSKKTLYKYFPSKEGLLRDIVRQRTGEIGEGVDRILGDEGLDFVAKLRRLMGFLAAAISRVGQLFMQDLQKGAPDIWRELDDFRRNKAMRSFSELLSEGVRKGAFRSDVDQHLLTLLYANSIQGIINGETLAQLPLTASQAFEGIIAVLFEGILTDDYRARYAAHPGR